MVLTVEDLGKSYGEKALFSHVNLNINEGDKIGIVGVNGTGKSTFLRTVAGRLAADTGSMVTMRNLRISFLEQFKEFEADNTVLMEAFKDDSPLMQALRNYESALAKSEAGDMSEEVQRLLVKASGQIDALNGWSMESEAKSILTHLGITDFEAKVSSLSSGQQKRLALATALIQPCDLLLLDEPTNHLDSETIGWLEEYLANWKGSLLMVTHDRYFLDRVASGILEFDKGRTYSYQGNYSEFLELKAARIEREEAGERKRQNFLRNELAWIRRGAQARSTKQKARIQRYEQVRDQKVDLERNKVEIGLAGSRLGRKIIELDHVSYEWEGKTYIEDLTYTVLRNDRIGILGGNGTGKSTLLNIIAGRLQPTGGRVDIGQTVKIGYFAQTNAEMDGRLRAKEYIQEAAHYITMADGTKLSAGQLMERFLFPPDLQYTEVARLSGGEKRRLYLLRVLMEAPNVLLLDEPTNDLDLETMGILENFIEDFNGAIIFVSHDRFFTDRMAKKVFVYDKNDFGKISFYVGGYSDYKARAEAEEKAAAKAALNSPGNKKQQGTDMAASAEKKPAQKEKTQKKGLTMSEKREYGEIEAIIASKEGELKGIHYQMELYAADYSKISELTGEETRVSAELEKLMERWAYLEEKAEEG
ncbi:MAG: ABC-F family ATP-binding cassette domain-containing protein [Anaerovibrio sp.]|uniref:ABC-F family ATP-binding cassette domain-containing protein n=1 Tax=Anaerovibrio sp. TaxID=1872532 RepID=UPI002631DA61|nr:ABC-F family ATP-binding cassette domain-containing protein [Anaerovibrio sp.]MDD7678009.1 ABC-F family ATP-binding cassette domain-containing protein [Anaerovibrio sp.]MDY2603337.1 ABC-F family ATP-binding cassette domain-containing protein [Anaerovibrio sp.]